MKLTTVTLVAIGYVLGAKAGHERYAQIIAGMETTSQRLEAFSSRHAPTRDPASTTVGSRASRSEWEPE